MKPFTYIICCLLTLHSCSDGNYLEFEIDENTVDLVVTNSTYNDYFANIDSSCILSITHEQLREGKKMTLKLPERCDSVDLEIPGGGTVTSACLYSDSTLKEKVAPYVSFLLGMNEVEANCITISSGLKGRYFLDYGSCHWGSELWINFE